MRRFQSYPQPPEPKRWFDSPDSWEQKRRSVEATENWLAGRRQKRYGYQPPYPWTKA